MATTLARRGLAFGLVLGLGLPGVAAAKAATDRSTPHRRPAPRERVDLPLVAGANRAAWEMWGLRPMGDRSACFCPLGLAETMALLESGARGDTAEEVCRIYGMPEEDFERQWPSLLRDLHELRPALTQLNWLFYRQGEQLFPLFRERVLRGFEGKVLSVNFGNPRQSVKHINAEVGAATRGKISNFLTTRDIRLDTQIVMTNVVNFQGEWTHPFAPSSTRPAPFLTLDQSAEILPMMVQVAPFAGLLQKQGQAMEDFDLLELPYRGGHLVMDVFLPTGDNDVSKLEKNLNYDKVVGYLKRLDQQAPEPTMVRFPRYHVSARADLSAQLQQLGLVKLFQTGADLSRMMRSGHGIRIDSVVQQATLSVDEVGTKAAAATAGIGSRGLVPTFEVNRPFMFVVRDKQSGAMVFIGRYCGKGA